MADDELPRVEGGKLTKPYPINSLADVSRARVLPPPKDAAKVPAFRAGQKIAEDVHKRLRTEKRGPYKDTDDVNTPSGDERPKGAIDYIQRRNRMMKGVSGRARSRSSSRRA